MTDQDKNFASATSEVPVPAATPLDEQQTAPAYRLYRLLYLFTFLLATSLTWLIGQNIEQFEGHAPVAFQDGFPGDLEKWSRHGGWENILFESNTIIVKREVNETSYAYRTFSLPPTENRKSEKLRITGSVKTMKKKSDTDDSDGGALMLWLQNTDNEVLKYTNIGKLDGQQDTYEIGGTFNLTDDITQYSLVLTNKDSSAEFALEDASIELITVQKQFTQIRSAVFVVWSFILAIALLYLFKHASTVMFVVMTTIILMTIVGVLMPETLSAETIIPLYAKLQQLAGITGDTLLALSYKVGHFLFFFLFTLLVLIYRKTLQLHIWEIFSLVLLFTVATEGLQLFLSDRTTRLSDLFIDFSAVLVGAVFAVLIISLRNNEENQIDTHN